MAKRLINKFHGSTAELAARIRFARGKPRAVREKIAREIPASLVSLDRAILKLNRDGEKSLAAKLRKDRGSSRAHSSLLANLAARIFFNLPNATYAAVQRDLATICADRGVKAPAYGWVKRAINAHFTKIMGNRNIQSLGHFQRRK